MILSLCLLSLAILVPLNNTRLDELEEDLGNGADTRVSPLWFIRDHSGVLKLI